MIDEDGEHKGQRYVGKRPKRERAKERERERRVDKPTTVLIETKLNFR